MQVFPSISLVMMIHCFMHPSRWGLSFLAEVHVNVVYEMDWIRLKPLALFVCRLGKPLMVEWAEGLV